jgi:predicted transcriptional regulator
MFITTDVNSQIISILKDYGTVPLEFLAKRLRKDKSEIAKSVDDLSQKHIVRISGEEVGLARKK